MANGFESFREKQGGCSNTVVDSNLENAIAILKISFGSRQAISKEKA